MSGAVGEGTSLAVLLALVERHGTSVLLARQVEPLASVEARAALHARRAHAGARRGIVAVRRARLLA